MTIDLKAAREDIEWLRSHQCEGYNAVADRFAAALDVVEAAISFRDSPLMSPEECNAEEGLNTALAKFNPQEVDDE